MDIKNSSTESPSSARRSRRGRQPRRIVTYAILTGGAASRCWPCWACSARVARVSVPATVPRCGAAVPRAPEPPDPLSQAPTRRGRRVELVFALDTTGSMSGLIEGAKQKIWSLASFVAQGQPTPDLRVGLIGYRDVGDAYVTKVFDLDDDLDRVYRRLRALPRRRRRRRAGARGARAGRIGAQDVVEPAPGGREGHLPGRRRPAAHRLPGRLRLRARGARGGRKGIQLHTIQCGTDHEAEVRVAEDRVAGRRPVHGDPPGRRHAGGALALRRRAGAALHDKLGKTAIGYGAGAPAVAAARATAEAAPAPVKAARAGFMAKNKRAVGGEGDLVESVASGRVKLADVQGDLPAEMKAMDTDEAGGGDRARSRRSARRSTSGSTSCRSCAARSWTRTRRRPPRKARPTASTSPPRRRCASR